MMLSAATVIRVHSLCAQMHTESHWLRDKASAVPGGPVGAGRQPRTLQAPPHSHDTRVPSTPDRWLLR